MVPAARPGWAGRPACQVRHQREYQSARGESLSGREGGSRGEREAGREGEGDGGDREGEGEPEGRAGDSEGEVTQRCWPGGDAGGLSQAGRHAEGADAVGPPGESMRAPRARRGVRERERGEWLRGRGGERGRGRGEEREREREVERERAEESTSGADLLRGHRGRRRWALHYGLPRYCAKGSTNLPAAKGHCQAGRRGREQEQLEAGRRAGSEMRGGDARRRGAAQEGT